MNRSMLAALALMSSIAASPVLAQDDMMMKDNMGMMMTPSGQLMMSEPMDKAMMDMAMKSAQPVPANTVFFMSGGKLYMMQDMKMENGMMMSDGMKKK